MQLDLSNDDLNTVWGSLFDGVKSVAANQLNAGVNSFLGVDNSAAPNVGNNAKDTLETAPETAYLEAKANNFVFGGVEVSKPVVFGVGGAFLGLVAFASIAAITRGG